MPTALVDHLRAPDPAGLRALLAPDARFHSPVADYAGRDDVAHLLTIIPTVLEDVHADRALSADGEVATFLRARVGDRRVDAVLDERYDAAGRLTEVTLMVRPLAALHGAVERMGRALADAPLPSAR